MDGNVKVNCPFCSVWPMNGPLPVCSATFNTPVGETPVKVTVTDTLLGVAAAGGPATPPPPQPMIPGVSSPQKAMNGIDHFINTQLTDFQLGLPDESYSIFCRH
jgi:hypothetical protein